MRLHIDVLGILHRVWGAFGVMAGLSLLILAAGTRAAMAHEAFEAGQGAAVVVLASAGGLLLLAGLTSMLIGLALKRLHGGARVTALVLALPNLLLVPFGTALGGYTFWVLLNDEARRDFGRVPRPMGRPE